MTQAQPSRFDEILFSCTAQTFESLAFMMILPPDEAQPQQADPDSLISTTVTFNGPFHGAVAISIPAAAMPVLAANMLGMDESEGPPAVEQQNDALKELANVLCGNLLPMLAGSQAVFSVGAPSQPAGGGDVKIEGLQQCGRANINLETGSAIALLYLDNPQSVAQGLP